MKLFFRIMLFGGILVLCSGCGMQESGDSGGPGRGNPTAGEAAGTWQYADTAMGTVVQQTIYGLETEAGNFFDCSMAVLTELEEELLSWRVETSEVFRINQSAREEDGCRISEDMALLLAACLELCERSEGTFDISLGPLTRLWNIDKWAAGEGQGTFLIPSGDEVREALSLCGSDRIRLTGEGAEERIFSWEKNGEKRFSGEDSKKESEETEAFVIYLPDGMQLDLGAVGKGLALSRLKNLLEGETGITGAVISLGGSILTWGEKPDNSPWKVGIVDPADTSSNVGILTLEGQWCVSTSGDYERYVETEGVRYHHILDPFTGYPAVSGVCGVTILAEDGLLSDGLSTACFLLGPEKGMALAEEYETEVLFIMEDGSIVMSEGMKKYFEEK